MKIKILMTSVMIALSARLAFAENTDRPKLPYYDWGACPFECCAYRQWVSTRGLNAHVSRSEGSPVTFRVKKDLTVRGLTGVVITRKYGVTRIVKPVQVGIAPDGRYPEISLQPGEAVYTLYYQGEGADLFWYRGKAYSAEIAVPDDAPPDSRIARVLSRPGYEWWVLIQDRDGNAGWTRETGAFAHIDACE